MVGFVAGGLCLEVKVVESDLIVEVSDTEGRYGHSCQGCRSGSARQLPKS